MHFSNKLLSHNERDHVGKQSDVLVEKILNEVSLCECFDIDTSFDQLPFLVRNVNKHLELNNKFPVSFCYHKSIFGLNS